MPPRRRNISRSRNEWNNCQHLQLLTGHDFFREAWGNDLLPPEVSDVREIDPATVAEMLAAWDDLGDELLAESPAGYRPWFWWVLHLPNAPREQFDPALEGLNEFKVPWPESWAPCWESRDAESSLLYLARLGHLDEAELSAVRRQAITAPRPFCPWDRAAFGLLTGTGDRNDAWRARLLDDRPILGRAR